MNDHTAPQDISTEAVLFAHQFATLVSAGMNLVSCLEILALEAPAPYAAAMPDVRARIMEGQSLSQAIQDLPTLFPTFFRMMIRSGEAGGILDIALKQTAEVLEEDWTLALMLGTQPLLMTYEPESPASRLTIFLFCRIWGMMLSSGVPILTAMETAAEVLPVAHRMQVLAARDVIKNRGSFEEIVAPMTFLPESARKMFIVGGQTGTLDTLLLKAAELYRYQLRYERQRA